MILASIFAAFYGGWLGRGMSDDEIAEALSADADPATFQHAIEQVTRRMTDDPEAAARFVPQLVELSREEALPDPDLRVLVVWAMQFDRSGSNELREALAAALADTQPLVRFNAATSLARHGDDRARPVLLEMLVPYEVKAPAAGRVTQLLETGHRPDANRRLARIEGDGADPTDVLSPFDGRVGRVFVSAEQQVVVGTPLMNLRPRSAQAQNALAGLFLVGTKAELPIVDRYASGTIEGLSDEVTEQAKATAARIRSGPLGE